MVDIRLTFRSMGKLSFLDIVNSYNKGKGLDYSFLRDTGLTTHYTRRSS